MDSTKVLHFFMIEFVNVVHSCNIFKGPLKMCKTENKIAYYRPILKYGFENIVIYYSLINSLSTHSQNTW